MALPAALGACGIEGARETPIDWWHDLQGGRISELRPPPPGSNDPYPNLASVPGRPQVISQADRQAAIARLIAQRDATAREAARNPLPTPAPPAPTAAPPARPDPNAATASLDAASAPRAPPPRPEPSAPADVPSPADAAVIAQPTPPPAGAAAAPPAPVTLPPVPGTPPTPPLLPGVPATSASVRPPSPDPAPAPYAPATFINFPAGSADLPSSSRGSLRDFAGRRAGKSIAVTGYGDAARLDSDTQSSALSLALRRAQAIATALAESGVPPTQLRLSAEAMGRGGAARLIN